jgi:hypothetical protein
MKLKAKNVVIAVLIYLVLLGWFFALNIAIGIVFLIYVVCSMLLARAFIRGAEERSSQNSVEFSQSGAANSMGIQYGSFHYVFYSKDAVLDAFREGLDKALAEKLSSPPLQDVTFKDVDRELPSPESRSFLVTTAEKTARDSGFSLLCNFTRNANMNAVQWWVLVSGMRDPNKLLWRYVGAPFQAPFKILAYMHREYDPVHGLMTIYPGFYNGIDVQNRTQAVQSVALLTLVEVLDSFGIDTTDLKIQKASMLNINVSGGQATFGSVVQGAMNKVVGMAGGAH